MYLRDIDLLFIYYWQRMLELLMVIVIIALTVVAVVPYLKTTITKAAVLDFAGLFDQAKRDVLVYHALNGDWPEGNEQAADSFINYDSSSQMEVARIENGAIHITFNNDIITGKTLTIRPHVPIADPLGPVSWLAGENGRKGIKAVGPDRTDIKDKYIPKHLK